MQSLHDCASSLAEREAARRDDGVSRCYLVDAEHACALSVHVVEKPRPGFPDQGRGRAEFCNLSWTSRGLVFGRASRIRATAPATCGDDMDVPLIFP